MVSEIFSRDFAKNVPLRQETDTRQSVFVQGASFLLRPIFVPHLEKMLFWLNTLTSKRKLRVPSSVSTSFQILRKSGMPVAVILTLTPALFYFLCLFIDIFITLL